MRTTILLIRHGETPWNREKIFRGKHDIPLNENGRAQARLAAAALETTRIDVACTSPLFRASETASIVLASHGIPAQTCDDLADLDYGDWTGVPDDDVAARWPREHAAWNATPHTATIPGGETLQHAFDRAFGAMEAIARKHDGQTVALFAHRVINKLLVLGALGLGLDRFPRIIQGNCCINELRRTDAGYLILRINDTAHIRNAGTELLEADF